MCCRYLCIGQILYFFLSIQNIITDNSGFVCPNDGRWPHPADCEKFYTCNSGTGAEAWCGHGMTYDVEHGRCDLSKNIDCKNGERPNWTPPSAWKTESITDSVIIKTTPRISNNEIEIEKTRETTVELTTIISTKLAHSRMLLLTNNLIENSPCTFQGNMPDQDNCQSYFTCKDDLITRFQCPDKHLFDEDLRSCNDYRKVFCGNRPTSERGNDPCTGQPNGWYADYGNQCRLYYLCTEQRRTKMGECPVGSKWNSQQLRCDDPRYIAAPCGYRGNNAISLSGHHYDYLTTLMTFSFILLIL